LNRNKSQLQQDSSLAFECVTKSPGTLRKELSLFDIVAIVVGTVIGSGIFLIPSFIAAQLDSLKTILLAWVVGGILTLFGALSLAELGSMYPEAGGLCTYLRQAYGSLPAFLYAWGLLLMIHSGSIAALAVGFGLYLGQMLPLGPIEQKGMSVLCILALTVVSCVGIRSGKRVQTVIAVAKIGGLALMIFLLSVKSPHPFRWMGSVPNANAVPLAGFGIALIAVLWAYEGWHVVSFVAGEMNRPQLDLPRGLLCGNAIVMIVYIVANLAYYHALLPGEIRHSDAVAALAAGKLFGPMAARSVSFLILVSILGCLNGLILTGPRVYYAMARDGIFPRVFSRISERYRTPMIALIVQGVWTAVLAASSSYQQLFTDVIFTAWIFNGLAVAAVLVLRRTQPQLDRPFRVPGYPWMPVIFCTAVIGLVFSNIVSRPAGALLGITLIAAGIPVYFIFVRETARDQGWKIQ
jgi:APA family basic amino acid/polyamine antiporter